MLPQSDRYLLLSWSKDIMILLDPKISKVLACIWTVNILDTTHNLKIVSPIGYLAQANIQFPWHAACIYSNLSVPHESASIWIHASCLYVYMYI